MNETICDFRSAAVRLAGMAEELSGQSAQLHQASLEQNQSAEELVGEVSHVKQQLASVAESSSQTQSKTEEITKCVQKANSQMAALSGAMDDISANALQITKIAKSIEDIAFQTNILAPPWKRRGREAPAADLPWWPTKSGNWLSKARRPPRMPRR